MKPEPDETVGPGPIGIPELEVGKIAWLELGGKPGAGVNPEPEGRLLADVTAVEGNVPVAEGKPMETLTVKDAAAEPSGWVGRPEVKHIVVVVVANTADVTTVKAFVGQSLASEAHSVMVK